jgi:hypothetical protein
MVRLDQDIPTLDQIHPQHGAPESLGYSQRLAQTPLPDLQAHYREVVGEATRCPNRAWLVRRIEETLADRKSPPAKSQEHEQLKPAKGAKAAKGRPQAEEPEQAPSKPTKPAKPAKGRSQAKKEAQPAEAPAPEASEPKADEVPQDATPAPASPEPKAEAAEDASAAPESVPAAEAPAAPASSEASPAAKPPWGRFSTMTVEQLQAKYLEVVGRPTGRNDRGYLIWKIREAEKGRIPVGPRAVRQSEEEPSDMKVLPLRLEGQAVEKMDEAWRSRGFKSRMEFLRRALAYYLTHLGADDTAALFAADDAQE